MLKQDIQAEIDFFDKVAEQGHLDTISEGIYSYVFDTIRPYIKEKVLEAGCGSGAFGIRIKKVSPKVRLYGIDLNKKMVEMAKQENIYESLHADNIENKDNFQSQFFDCIVCPYLLHHLPDIKASMENFSYWLKPGGALVIIDPNGSNNILRFSYTLRVIITKLINKKNTYASINERHKSIKEFRKNLKGFSIVSITTFQHELSSGNQEKNHNLISILGGLRKQILFLYEKLPWVKYGGSDVIIVARKNEIS